MDKNITAQEAAHVLSYDPNTGLFTKNGRLCGTPNGNGYLRISINRRLFYAHRLAWLLMTGEWPENQIDHINRNRCDNRFSNLRKCDHSQNGQNASLSRRNSSGYTGVSWASDANKWRATIVINRKRIHLCYANTAKEASDAYQAAKSTMHAF